jgi:Tol biopolymer transport system component
LVPACGDGSSKGAGSLVHTLGFPEGVTGRHPRFSPDGSSIAYLRKEGDVEGVATMSVDGEDSATLTTDGNYLTAVTWTRDGSEIIYYGDLGIRAVPAAGGPGRFVVDAFAALDPDLSPEGDWLVYGENGGTMKLADLRATPAVEEDLGVFGSSPRFSPDGTFVAFHGSGTINLMNLGSRTVTELIASSNDFGGVDWFSDGQRLLAGTERGLEVLTLGPPLARTLINDQFALLSVDLSPDDRNVAYDVNGHPDLYIMTGL